MAQQQNYKNHLRFYPPHHFVFYPFMLALLVGAIYYASKSEENRLIWIFMALFAVAIIWLAFMLRQHYALTLQNRIIIQEVHYRYFVVTGNQLELLGDKLSDSQIFALRFAPDDELEALVNKTLQENLSPNAIKRTIKNWRVDNCRV